MTLHASARRGENPSTERDRTRFGLAKIGRNSSDLAEIRPVDPYADGLLGLQLIFALFLKSRQ